MIFMLFLLNDLLNVLSFGKYFLNGLKSSISMLVELRIMPNGVMFSVFMFFRLLVFFCVFHFIIMFTCFVAERSSFLRMSFMVDDYSEILFIIVSVNVFMMYLRWFECL